jgi:hypothetical protein
MERGDFPAEKGEIEKGKLGKGVTPLLFYWEGSSQFGEKGN